MKDLKYEHQSIFLLWGRVKLNFRDRYKKSSLYSKNPSCYQVFSSISKTLSLWCIKKLLPTQMDLYDPYMAPCTISWGNYNFPRSTKKIQCFDKISTSGKKIVDFMKDLKYEHQIIFSLWGRVKCHFRARYRKPNVYSKTSSHYQVFPSNSQKMTLWCKKNIAHPY